MLAREILDRNCDYVKSCIDKVCGIGCTTRNYQVHPTWFFHVSVRSYSYTVAFGMPTMDASMQLNRPPEGNFGKKNLKLIESVTDEITKP